MNISTFDELLQAAQQQPHAQRLLLVFAGASAPEHSSDSERARVEAGSAGELTPLMCVDKTPEAIGSFAAPPTFTPHKRTTQTAITLSGSWRACQGKAMWRPQKHKLKPPWKAWFKPSRTARWTIWCPSTAAGTPSACVAWATDQAPRVVA